MSERPTLPWSGWDGDGVFLSRRGVWGWDGMRLPLLLGVAGLVIPIVAVVLVLTRLGTRDLTVYYITLLSGVVFFVAMLILGALVGIRWQEARLDARGISITRHARIRTTSKAYDLSEFMGLVCREERIDVRRDSEEPWDVVLTVLGTILGGIFGAIFFHFHKNADRYYLQGLVLKHRWTKSEDVLLLISMDPEEVAQMMEELSAAFSLPVVE